VQKPRDERELRARDGAVKIVETLCRRLSDYAYRTRSHMPGRLDFTDFTDALRKVETFVSNRPDWTLDIMAGTPLKLWEAVQEELLPPRERPLKGNTLDPPDDDEALPYWLLDAAHRCRAVECLPECPAYDAGCRIRADEVAGDTLRQREAALREIADEPCRFLLLYHTEDCTKKLPRREWCMTCRARDAMKEP
jgi:hypothetical protein